MPFGFDPEPPRLPDGWLLLLLVVLPVVGFLVLAIILAKFFY